MPVTIPLRDRNWVDLERGSMLHDEVFDDEVTVIMDDDTWIKNCHFTGQATIIFRSKNTVVSNCVFDGDAVFVGAYEGASQLFDRPVIERCRLKRTTLIGKPVVLLRNIETGGNGHGGV